MDVSHVAKLANLVLKPGESDKFAKQFADTLDTVNLMNQLDTSSVQPTSQVTGLVNITRADEIDASRILSVEAALSNASSTHNGYFVVPAIFDE